MSDMDKIEVATSAQSKGRLKWEEWSYDVITAIGLAAHKNKLGFSIVRYLSEPNPNKCDILAVVHDLADKLEKNGMKWERAVDSALCAFSYWQDQRCPHCHGRGVIDFEQTECDVCRGTGKKPKPTNADVLNAISTLITSEIEMDNQLRKRLSY